MARSGAKNGGNYTTTRAVYKNVKRYDHSQFDTFCTRVYAEGFRDGMAAVPGVDVSEVMEVIRQVKGIGPVMIMRIDEAMNQRFGEETNEQAGQSCNV